MSFSAKALRVPLRACVRMHGLPTVLSLLLLFTFFTFSAQSAMAAASTTPTVTTINGPLAVTVAAGDICQLTASVTANGAPVTAGFVTFLEGSVPLGTVAVQADGTATFHVWLPPGFFLISANFSGSDQGAPSSSEPASLPIEVSQEGLSSTSLSASGTGPYTLIATVTGDSNQTPFGAVTFTDQTTHTVLGTAPLAAQGVTSSLNPVPPAKGIAGDFNGDGRIDYATVSSGPGGTPEVIVMLANADGTYTTVTSTPFVNPQFPMVFAVADFNGDGLTDLAIFDSGSLYILLSDGAGHFTAGNGPTGLSNDMQFEAVGDFNSDGKMDVLVNLGPTATTSVNLAFLEGDGDGNLAAPQPSSADIYPVFGTADFNLDGNLDLIGTPIDPETESPGPQTIYLGAGDGIDYSQLPQSNFGGYVQPTPVPVYVPIVADFNGDGIPDLVFFNGGSTVTVLLGDGKGNFDAQTPIVTDIGNHNEGYAVPLDINGDGVMDLAVSVEDQPQQHDQPPPPYNMIELIGDGRGHFAVSPEVPTSSAGFGAYATAPVPYTYPSLGTTAPGFSALAPAPPVGTAVAALVGINLNGAGKHTIVATYNGIEPLPASSSAPLSLTQAGTGGPVNAPIAFGQGFTAGGMQLNGSAQLVGSAIELTDGGANEAGSAFFPVPMDDRGFDTEFTFQLDNAQADGFTLTFQDVNPQALGGTGGSLGYAGIPNSRAISFDLFDNNGEGANSIGFYGNGEQPDDRGGNYDLTALSGGTIDLRSGDIFKARIVCCYQNNLTVQLTDTNTGASTTVNWPEQNLGPTPVAYVGFTGATGALTSTQKILSWSYSPLPNYFEFNSQRTAVEPAMSDQGMMLNGGVTVSSAPGEMQLISTGIANQATSAYFQTPVDVRHFSTTFYFQGSNIMADGFTFVLQNAGLYAVGPSGGGLGYGPDTPYGNVGGGVPESAAIKFDFYDNAGEGTDSTGAYVDGSSPTEPALTLEGTGIVLTSGDLFRATLTYDGTTLTETISDVTSGATATETYEMDIPGAVGGDTAYAGFTAGTGALSGTENILDWVYVPAYEPQ